MIVTWMKYLAEVMKSAPARMISPRDCHFSATSLGSDLTCVRFSYTLVPKSEQFSFGN